MPAHFGVSPEKEKALEERLKKLGIQEKDVLEKYGVWQKKKIYGKEYMGVVRSTFLIDPEGKIKHVWRKVKVNGHVDKVMQKLIELRAQT